MKLSSFRTLFFLATYASSTMGVQQGDAVCVEGYVVCPENAACGATADPLLYPEEIKIECIVNTDACNESGFLVLLDPNTPDSLEYTPGYRLDREGTEAIALLAQAVGSCESCYRTGVIESGFRAGIKGEVVDAESAPPVISVFAATHLEAGEVYCPEPAIELPSDVPSDVPSDMPTSAPSL